MTRADGMDWLIELTVVFTTALPTSGPGPLRERSPPPIGSEGIIVRGDGGNIPGVGNVGRGIPGRGMLGRGIVGRGIMFAGDILGGPILVELRALLLFGPPKRPPIPN